MRKRFSTTEALAVKILMLGKCNLDSSLGVRGCFVFFFFSSRRRHTRSLCDWSSDVCSSDLAQPARFPRLRRGVAVELCFVGSLAGEAEQRRRGVGAGIARAALGLVGSGEEIGRASCRERV